MNAPGTHDLLQKLGRTSLSCLLQWQDQVWRQQHCVGFIRHSVSTRLCQLEASLLGGAIAHHLLLRLSHIPRKCISGETVQIVSKRRLLGGKADRVQRWECQQRTVMKQVALRLGCGHFYDVVSEAQVLIYLRWSAQKHTFEIISDIIWLHECMTYTFARLKLICYALNFRIFDRFRLAAILLVIGFH